MGDSSDLLRGLDLAEAFHRHVVGPLLAREFAGLRYAAALIGPGSEVLDLDDDRSRDHDWGPRLQILLDHERDDERDDDPVAEVRRRLDRLVPDRFLGRPTRFPVTNDQVPRLRIAVSGRRDWFVGRVGFDPLPGIGLVDWLSAPTQRLAECTAGRVFHDASGALGLSRSQISWYPDDLWRWLLACQWHRIAQEEPFPGRCAERGDLLGAAVVHGRLVRDVMRLWLLMGRVYPPYSKWLGTAFGRLPGVGEVPASLRGVMCGPDFAAREACFGAALRRSAARQNELGLAPRLSTELRPFHDRPFPVLDADRFATALISGIQDPMIRRLPLLGAADQVLDSTDVLERPELIRALGAAIVRPGVVDDG